MPMSPCPPGCQLLNWPTEQALSLYLSGKVAFSHLSAFQRGAMGINRIPSSCLVTLGHVCCLAVCRYNPIHIKSLPCDPWQVVENLSALPNTASKTGSKCSFSSLNSAFSPVSCALGVFPCLGCLDNVFQQPARLDEVQRITIEGDDLCKRCKRRICIALTAAKKLM